MVRGPNGGVRVALGLTLFKIAALFGVAIASCATTDKPAANCNPVMVQCNPGDYPPLTAMLPKWPFPRPPSEWVNSEAPTVMGSKAGGCQQIGAQIDVGAGLKGPDDIWRYPSEPVSKPCPDGGRP